MATHDVCPTSPKIELHVHFEGTVRPASLLRMAKRNGVTLPANDVPGLERYLEFRDFQHFLEIWLVTTSALRHYDDFRETVVAYAGEAAAHGAVYLEGIFTPSERVSDECPWDEVMAGFCDGAQEAREVHGVDVRLTTDINAIWGLAAMEHTLRYSLKYHQRGVVGIGIGGHGATPGHQELAQIMQRAKREGLGSVPHAGESTDPEAIRWALESVEADRIRHGIAAARDAGLLRELSDRGIVCDVCPTSNVLTRSVPSLADHPLPIMRQAGVLCSINTDDPAMFATDLTSEHAIATTLGCSGAAAFGAGLRGALCDADVRRSLLKRGREYGWSDEELLETPTWPGPGIPERGTSDRPFISGPHLGERS